MQFRGHPLLRSLISERDEEILAYLDDVRVQDEKSLMDWTVTMVGAGVVFVVDMGWIFRVCSHYVVGFCPQVFSENPFFEDRELSKTFKQDESGDLVVESTEIKWKVYVDRERGSLILGAVVSLWMLVFPSLLMCVHALGLPGQLHTAWTEPCHCPCCWIRWRET